MQDKIKDIIITLGFVIILGIVFLLNIISKDNIISSTERRKLAQFPTIKISNFIDENFSDKFEAYAVDQFVGRDMFRSLKSFCSLNVFRQKDNNNLFVKDNSIYKMDYKLNISNVKKSANKISEIYDKYLKKMNVYYAIIPDKNYYLENDDHLKLDYKKMLEIMEQELEDIEYINIWDSLMSDDYYRTDLHWKQENIKKIAYLLQSGMHIKDMNLPTYTVKNMGDFYGVYYGQLGVKVLPDTLNILTNDTIENCTTYNYETRKRWNYI